MQYATLSAAGLIVGISLFAADLLPEDCEAQPVSIKEISTLQRQSVPLTTDSHARKTHQTRVEFF